MIISHDIFSQYQVVLVVITVTPWAKSKGIAGVALKPANIKTSASPKTTGFIELLNEKQIVT